MLGKSLMARGGAWLLIAGLATITVLAACEAEPTIEPPPVLVPTRPGGEAPTLEVGDLIGGGETEEVIAPTVTLEGEATPTMAATPTPTPASVETPVTDPPIQAVSGAPLPDINRNLIFMADGALKVWNQRRGQIETVVDGPDLTGRVPSAQTPFNEFPGDVTAFSTSRDGKRAVVAKLTSIEVMTSTAAIDSGAAQEISLERQTHELLFVDLVSGEQWRIVPQVVNLTELALSPNAERVAFTGSTLSGTVEPTAERVWPQTVFVTTTGGGSNPGTPTPLHMCDRGCSPLVWHIESNLVVWSDPQALWLHNVAGSQAEVLLENRSELPDVAIYSPRSWARNGRFLLMYKGSFEGASQAILDVPTGTILDIPDSFTYVDPFPVEIMWMPDDRLFVLRTGDNLTPTAELWRPLFGDNSVVKEETLQLTTGAGVLGQMYLEDGRFAYGLVSQNPAQAGVYRLTSLSETPVRENAIPAAAPELGTEVRSVHWSADGSGALVVHRGVPYYAPAEGTSLYNMAAAFGADAHGFEWQPEIVIQE